MVVGEGLLGLWPRPAGRCCATLSRFARLEPSGRRFSILPDLSFIWFLFFLGGKENYLKMVVGEGFEPSKSMTADLQSAPFGRSGTPPQFFVDFYYVLLSHKSSCATWMISRYSG